MVVEVKMYKDDEINSIIKAYDVRGIVETQITEQLTFDIGCAFAQLLLKVSEPKTVVIGEDMRPSSRPLADAFSAGLQTYGFNVIRVGLASTDMLYFVSGSLNLPGAMFTASHNPAKYNGIKLCKSGARPIGNDSGLDEIRKTLLSQKTKNDSAPVGAIDKEASNTKQQSSAQVEKNFLGAYVNHLLSILPEFSSAAEIAKSRKLKIVIDAGNGMAGYTAPAIFEKLNFEVVPMYFELDGNFPNHEANPIDAKNLVDLQSKVLSENADIGLAFDGDADRCFVVDNLGKLISPSVITGLIATRELKKHKGASIIYNLISSKMVPEVIAENGGVAIKSRVGHSYIKQLMAETGAVFGGEHSGHFYFADFWKADSGALAALYLLAELARSQVSLSELSNKYLKYFESGEINLEHEDPKAKIADVKNIYLNLIEAGEEFSVEELDGLTVNAATYWFNLRPSNTEPLLRVNIEAHSLAELESIKSKVLAQLA